MRAEITTVVGESKQSLGLLRRHLDFDKARARLAELNHLAEDPNLWNDPQRASRLMQERTSLEDSLTAIGRIERDVEDQVTMIELGDDENDPAVVADAEAA